MTDVDATPSHNAPLTVRHRGAGVRPLVIAWEYSSRDRPSFVLYDDGRWVRLEQPGLEDERYAMGRVTPAEAERFGRAVLDADLLAVPPDANVNQALVGGNTIRIGVRDGARWFVASVAGMRPRWTRK